jgi:magnesium chelatase family protein
MTIEEKLEANKIYSISKQSYDNSFINIRPFRNPHYTITKMGLIGGGNQLRVGEITLAHRGILFLDELTEFKPRILDLLRTPLEEGKINISRGNYNVVYPSRFILICAMNPCPCGYLGSKYKECTCSNTQISSYNKRISGPLLDRIDININVQIVQKEEYINESTESSSIIKARVDRTRKIQLERYKNEEIYCNSELTVPLIKKYCYLDQESKKLLLDAVNSRQLSTRTYFKIIKLARTIADMEESKLIKINHIIEAIHYKNT